MVLDIVGATPAPTFYHYRNKTTFYKLSDASIKMITINKINNYLTYIQYMF